MNAVTGQFKLPNVRKLFIPDTGYCIIDADIAGADARVAAWECGGRFKDDFIGGIKIHVETLKQFFPKRFAIDPKCEPEYTKCKNMAFGTTYAGGAKTISAMASIPFQTVKAFQPWWFGKYPSISDWHKRVEHQLQTTRSVSNAFGYRIIFFDRVDQLLPEALAWIPQSTVAIICQKAMRILKHQFPEAQMLLQVHDSIIFQLPIYLVPSLLPKIREAFQSIVVPYPDPLRAPWEFKSSLKSWGECSPVDFSKLQEAMAYK